MPELKGLVTKAGDIWRLQNPGAVRPLSVSRAGSDFTGKVKPVSHTEFQSVPASRDQAKPGVRAAGAATTVEGLLWGQG